MTASARTVALALVAAAGAALTGCSGGPVFGKVTGQVLVKGKPAEKVRVEFHPDASAGTDGPSSFADTDADGRFTLAYATPKSSGVGAVAGKHKVVLMDMRMAESETGRDVPF
ncbi:MAG: hypothetical protein ACRC33_02645, partial [Gemmataceae bacterium]